MDSALKTLATLTLALLLYACGGSGGNSQNPERDFGPVSQFEISPGGIWEANLDFDLFPFVELDPDSALISTQDSEAVFSLSTEEQLFLINRLGTAKYFITETGKFYFVQSDSFGISHGLGQITKSDMDGVMGNGIVETARFADDSSALVMLVETISGSCELTGTFTEYSAGYMTMSCSYSDGTENTTILDFVAAEDCSSGFCSFSSTAYENPFSLAEIAGSYESALVGPIISSVDLIEKLEISAAGTITGSNGLNAGCAIDGQISIADENFNLYEVSWTLSECEIPQANGTEISGLAAVRAFGDSLYLETIAEIASDQAEGPNIVALRRNYLRLSD